MSRPERRIRERVAVSFGTTGTAQPKGQHEPRSINIPAGTVVLIQKLTDPRTQYESYRTQQQIDVKKIVKRTAKALLIMHEGYRIWVDKRKVKET